MPSCPPARAIGCWPRYGVQFFPRPAIVPRMKPTNVRALQKIASDPLLSRRSSGEVWRWSANFSPAPRITILASSFHVAAPNRIRHGNSVPGVKNSLRGNVGSSTMRSRPRVTMPFSCDIRDFVTRLLSARTAVTQTTVNFSCSSFSALTAPSMYLNMARSVRTDLAMLGRARAGVPSRPAVEDDTHPAARSTTARVAHQWRVHHRFKDLDRGRDLHARRHRTTGARPLTTPLTA